MVVADLEVAAQGLEFGGLEAGADPVLVLEVALGALHRGVDHQGGVVGLHGVGAGHAAVLLLVGGDEGLGLRIVEVRRPVGAAVIPDRRVLLGRQGALVDREGGEERDRAQARLTVLAHQVDAHAAGHEREHRVGLGGRDLGELTREVELAERGEHLVHHLALVGMLEAGERVLAGLVVRREQDQALVALVLGVLAQHLVDLIVLVGGDEQVRVALRPGIVRGAGIGRDQEGAAVGHRTHHRAQHVGEGRADHEVDPVALHQFPRLVGGDIGLQLVVDRHHLGVQAAELLAEGVQCQQEPVAALLAEHRGGAREGEHQPDPDLPRSFPLALRGGGTGQQRGAQESGREAAGVPDRRHPVCPLSVESIVGTCPVRSGRSRVGARREGDALSLDPGLSRPEYFTHEISSGNRLR